MSREIVLAAARARRMLATGEARRIREASGATQRDVADALGIERATIEHWESGKRRARTDMAAAYVDLLDELAAITRTEASQ